jgi:hypothetical protein
MNDTMSVQNMKKEGLKKQNKTSLTWTHRWKEFDL